MSASTTATPSSTSTYTTPAFWERLWRMSGINFVIFFIIAYLIYGYQPRVGASAASATAGPAASPLFATDSYSAAGDTIPLHLSSTELVIRVTGAMDLAAAQGTLERTLQADDAISPGMGIFHYRIPAKEFSAVFGVDHIIGFHQIILEQCENRNQLES